MAPFYMLFSIYLRSLGLSYSSVGLISMAALLLSSVPQALFGHLMDRYSMHGQLTSVSLFLRAVCLLMVSLSQDMWSSVLWYISSSLAMAAFMPAIQSIVAQASVPNRLGRSMGLYRLGGAAGWAVMCLVSGYAAHATSDFRMSFTLGAFLSLACFLMSLPLRDPMQIAKTKDIRDPGVQAAKPSSGGLFYASVFIASLGLGATSSFVTVYLAEAGGDMLYVGTVLAFGAFVEVPGMYLGGRLSDSFGAPIVLSAGMAGLALSYWLYGAVDELAALLLVQGVRGLFYALSTVSGMTMSSALGGETRGALYAGMYNLVTTLGSSSGPYLAGVISDQLGLRSMFGASSIASLAGSLLAGVAHFRAKKEQPK